MSKISPKVRNTFDPGMVKGKGRFPFEFVSGTGLAKHGVVVWAVGGISDHLRLYEYQDCVRKIRIRLFSHESTRHVEAPIPA